MAGDFLGTRGHSPVDTGSPLTNRPGRISRNPGFAAGTFTCSAQEELVLCRNELTCGMVLPAQLRCAVC